MEGKWQVAPEAPQEFIDSFPEDNPIVLQLLHGRGIVTKEGIAEFLAPNYDTQVLDPYLFKDMEKAVSRVMDAMGQRERVMVYGDYDADGVCATTLLYTALKGIGLEVDTYIPFRESEGYGLNKKVVHNFMRQGYGLVITVDCGVSNAEEIGLLKENGIDTIVLDHHLEPARRPEAVAIINSSLSDSGYPFSELCGAGVVFKFIQAMLIKLESSHSPIKLPPGFDKWLLDLVAIATVGDIVPLVGENRVFTKYGLIVMEKTRNIGLRKLMEAISSKSGRIDTTYIGWRIVPRINAAGRIDHASLALNLLLAGDENEAERMAAILETNNKSRQQLTERILNEALSQVGEVADEQRLLFLAGDGWPAGVVGLVAGRICDRFNRPTLVMSRDEDGKYVGSGRSIPQFHITDALKSCAESLARFGGHSQACGFTVIGDDNLEKFKAGMLQAADEVLAGADLSPKLDIDAKVTLREINWELWEELEKFEPFGEGNPKPVFAAFGLTVEQVQPVGADGKHLRLMAGQAGKTHKFIGFSFGEWCSKLTIGDIIDVAFELDINEWNGNRELQLRIVDLRKP